MAVQSLRFESIVFKKIVVRLIWIWMNVEWKVLKTLLFAAEKRDNKKAYFETHVISPTSSICKPFVCIAGYHMTSRREVKFCRLKLLRSSFSN